MYRNASIRREYYIQDSLGFEPPPEQRLAHLERLKKAAQCGEVLTGFVESVNPHKGVVIALGVCKGLVSIKEIRKNRQIAYLRELRPGMAVQVVVLDVEEQGKWIR